MSTTTTGSADGLYGVGYWFFDQQRYDDAKHFFRAMLFVAPRDARGWLALGACHEGTDELEKASRLYTLAEAACGASARVFVALGRVLRRLDREADARAAYERASELLDAAEEPDLAVILAREGALR